jgi:hypothetical protein
MWYSFITFLGQEGGAGSLFVAQAGLELEMSSVSHMLGLQECATTPSPFCDFNAYFPEGWHDCTVWYYLFETPVQAICQYF